jgi:hypothetical protein
MSYKNPALDTVAVVQVVAEDRAAITIMAGRNGHNSHN